MKLTLHHMLNLSTKFILQVTIVCSLSAMNESLTAQQIAYTDGKNSWNPDSGGSAVYR